MLTLAIILATTFGDIAGSTDVGSISEIAAISNTLDRVVAFNSANTNVWFSATNYYETSGVPCSLQLYEIRDGETRTVWDQRKWARYYTDAAVESVTNRNSWSRYQSGTGAANPLTNTTWVSTPRVAMAGGLEWQKTVVAQGEVYVLVSNGMVADLNATTNSFFAIRDLEDNDILSIKRTASVTLGATASSVSATNGVMYATYAVVSETHPTASIAVTLADGGLYFYEEGATGCPATVAWSGQSGAWTMAVTPIATTSQLFARASYSTAGSTIVESTAPMKATLLAVGGEKIRAKVVNGAVTWEVVP